MNRLFPISLLGTITAFSFFLFSCSKTTEKQEVKTKTLSVVNLDSLNRPDEPVVVSRQDLATYLGEIPNGQVPLLLTMNGKDLPSQTDDLNGDGQWDELAFVCSLASYDSMTIEVILIPADSLPIYPARTSITYGRKPSEKEPITSITEVGFGKNILPYQANQMDGPAWENDKVGYRIYLDGRNAHDVFGKKVPYMVLQNVGNVEGEPKDNYHVLADWGRDVLQVGTSLGAGGLGLYENGQLFRVGITLGEKVSNVDSTVYQLVSMGPVRSIFRLGYYGWHAGSQVLNLENTISIWAGSHSYRNEVKLSGAAGEVELITGLVSINNQNPLFQETFDPNWVGIGMHDKNTYEREFFLGLGMLVPKEHFVGVGEAPKEGKGITQTYYARLKAKNNEPFTYHVLSGWEMEDQGYTQSDYFYDLVRHEASRLNHPVKVVFGEKGI